MGANAWILGWHNCFWKVPLAVARLAAIFIVEISTLNDSGSSHLVSSHVSASIWFLTDHHWECRPLACSGWASRFLGDHGAGVSVGWSSGGWSSGGSSWGSINHSAKSTWWALVSTADIIEAWLSDLALHLGERVVSGAWTSAWVPLATVLSTGLFGCWLFAERDHGLKVALGSFVGAGEWCGGWSLVEQWLVPDAAVLLAGLLSGWVLAEVNHLLIGRIRFFVSAGVLGLAW